MDTITAALLSDETAREGIEKGEFALEEQAIPWL